MAKIKEIRKAIARNKPKTKFEKAVIIYANEILDSLEEREGDNWDGDVKKLLNGARSWQESSKSGDYLVYIDDLKARLIDKNSIGYGTKDDELIGLQGRALALAAGMINESNAKIDKLERKPGGYSWEYMSKQPKVNNATLNKWARGRR